jgi:tetratricopeptide (TPR) repeat protein
MRSDESAVTVSSRSGSALTAAGPSIEALRQRVGEVPGDWRAWAGLSLAYVAEAGATADAGYYSRADTALQRSFELRPSNNFEAAIGRGALALARHRFSLALRWGRRAREINPFAASALGVIGDAQLELGRYGAAFATLQRMVEVKPGASSYARASYVRELLGDVSGAEEAMQLSLDAASTPGDRAFAAHLMGDLAWGSGRPAIAARWYRKSIAFDPTYVPAQGGLAMVAWANGRMDAAIDLYRRAVDSNPDYAAELGDLYLAAGRPVIAERQFELARAVERSHRAGGANVELEVALFEADHGHPRAALDAARVEWRRRRSIHVADALGWAHYRNGNYAAAARFSSLALELGTGEALFHFHRGMIELALGNRSQGLEELRLAVEINPHFSIRHSATAARLLWGGGTAVRQVLNR